MTKLKRWLYQKFLPAWCREDLLEKHASLEELTKKQRREIEVLHAYIDGMEYALRRGGGKR